ncbi:TonB-dependent receptor [Mucilaginibacter limnophilus]|uniref:TonB-dependent receptor n=1 Tax=Mucilaginibacter limnophilus TaxID=1932778 RepID=A0A3S2VA11_9SPHI|nr:TonB-dependent receptor [Mucilaginibacter limnophilus]RVU02437.1 TonB-dependent receptor [Mucilaginibacter limnophilus]
MKRRFTFFFFLTCLFFVPVLLHAQDIQVKGKVISKDDNLPLPGVSVVVKGTTRGTVTGPNGDFSIAAPAGATLEFTQIGMNPVSVAVVNTNPLTISMVSNTATLSEVVVVGYGVQKKKVVTGAISSVKASQLESQPITRVEQALQGRVSGVTIAANNGQPGEAASVRIRGLSSFTANDPLWVVDGIVVDNGGISYLNASDIESIDVLKDAASQAIYGTRASNGVILVTTKKGKAGSLQLNYNGFYGTSAPARKLNLLNATQYAVLRNEAAAADGNALPYANPMSYGEGTDWQEAIFNNSAKRQNHEISLAGGGEKSTFYSSFGYLDQEGIVATDISRYKRINFRLNSTHKVFKNFTIGQNLGYAYNKTMGLGNTNSEFGGPLASAIHLDPITPLVETDPTKAAAYDARARRNAEGFPYGISSVVGQEMTNPLAYISTRLGNHSWGHNFVGNVYAELEIIPNLKVRSTFGGKMAFWGAESFTPEYYLNSSNINTMNQLYRESNRRVDWNISNTISYNRSFDKHNVTLLLGQEFYQDGSSHGQYVRYDGIPATTYEQASFNYSVPNTQRASGASDGQYHRVASLFARLNYNFQEKYLLEGVIRRDGSTRFGANNQYGIFPSFGAGWVPTMEDFWPKNDVVDFLKIRGSYGIVGNDNIGDFTYISTIGSGRNAAIGTDSYEIGYSPNAPANPDLRWEETRSANIGFEATILHNIRFNFDWFNKKTNGILQYPRIPAYVGAISNPAANVADMENQGFEFELGWNKTINDVKLDINGNFSTLKNKVTFLQEGISFINGDVGFQNLQYGVTRTMVGESFNSYYGFKELGIFQTQEEIDQYTGAKGRIQPNAKPGDFKWKDVDGDGDIDENDREVLGTSLPKYTYGINVNVAWKNFDLAAFGQGAGGNMIFSGLRRFGITAANYQTEALGRWTGPGTSNTYPRLSESDPNYNFRNPSDFYLQDGDYFRIKTLQIGYTFPKALISKAKLSRLRIYVMSENLVTFTKYTGYDPEIGGNVFSIDRGVYPQARSFFVGVNVGL